MEGFNTTGWLFYCGHCKAKRTARLVKEAGPKDGQEYFELICDKCASILVTMERDQATEPGQVPS